MSMKIIDESMNFIIKQSVLFYNFTIIFPYILLFTWNSILYFDIPRRNIYTFTAYL